MKTLVLDRIGEFKTYRIINNVTHEVERVTAKSKEEACRFMGWDRSICYVRELDRDEIRRAI